ncbi:Hypothetical protein CINCED_3A019718 [Cinara cedri]|uniref:Uncharacterized protein n=1 Tax=Cinara cedri TaxID=506608 RepID=A0A5E4N3P5_9HEMI|nr:Hypothetical protein CINCED_3A019718 [Cinara cedri]
MRFLPTIVWFYYTMWATVDVGRCFVVPGQEKTLFHIARGVLQNDMHWKHIIEIEMPVNTDEMDLRVADMLTELGFENNKVKAQPILRYLTTNPGSTSTQLLFGIKILANAMSCQFANTLGLNMLFITMLSYRKTVFVNHIREHMSRFQVTLSKYIDKLAVFGEPINIYVTLSNNINKLFEHHNTTEIVDKKVYTDNIKQISNFIKVIRDDRCGETQSDNWSQIAETIRVAYYTPNLFNKMLHNTVADLQLASMIESMDQYEFIDFSSLDDDFWNKRLDVVKYVRSKMKN